MSNPEGEEEQHLATLDELEATQAQISSYQGLLKDLPEIFERKFNERLQPLLDRQEQLLQEREKLLDRLQLHLPEGASGHPGSVLPSPPSAALSAGRPATVISRRWWGRLGWLVGLALVGGLIGVHVSQSMGKRSGSTSMVPRDGMGDRPGWELQTTRGPAPALPTPPRPETAPV